MRKVPILYWPRKAKSDNEYQTARRVINSTTGLMPEVITEELDIATIFSEKPDAVIYYPVFYGSTGWWGE